MAGSLVCVGVGMTLGAHISPINKSHIEQADVVFSLMSNALVAQWIDEMNPDVRSLQPYYVEGERRNLSYQNMIDAMIEQVKAGKKVVGAFYGHPGVFSIVPHQAIKQCHQLGFDAMMLAGISAQDCLYADLAIDPGSYGCQDYEASQFMFFERVIDPSAYLILWQVGIAGDLSLSQFATTSAYRQLLVELLAKDYPLDHQVILYRAAVLPTQQPWQQRLDLSQLATFDITLDMTLVIPPARKMKKNEHLCQQLAQLVEQDTQANQKTTTKTKTKTKPKLCLV